MVKRIIGAVIGIVITFIIFKIFVNPNIYAGYSSEVKTQQLIFITLGGILVAYIADGFKPKSKQNDTH